MKNAFLYRQCFVAVGDKEVHKEKQLEPGHKDRMSPKNKSPYYKSSLLHKNGWKENSKISFQHKPPHPSPLL